MDIGWEPFGSKPYAFRAKVSSDFVYIYFFSVDRFLISIYFADRISLFSTNLVEKYQLRSKTFITSTSNQPYLTESVFK